MRKTVAKWIVAMGAGFALVVGQGCRKQAASVAMQPAVRVPRVQPDLRVGSLPVGSLGPRGRPSGSGRATSGAGAAAGDEERRYGGSCRGAEETGCKAVASNSRWRRKNSSRS